MAWLEARSLRKEFPLAGSLKVALDDFSLSVGREDFVGIVGRSGSGKTTFLRIVAGLLEMTSGELSFEGDPEGEEGGTTRPKIGMVFQEPRLLPWLSVRENVLFAFLNDPKPTQPRERADALIEMLGLGGYEKAYPSQLSGGMAQRVALGRALCYEPEMILMDEPLGALDYFTRSALRDEILGIYLSGGKTILLVTSPRHARRGGGHPSLPPHRRPGRRAKNNGDPRRSRVSPQAFSPSFFGNSGQSPVARREAGTTEGTG